MTDPDRVLRPLREAEPAIDSLDTYDSPVALLDALRATWHAVERTLRTLLRSDATAPDEIRMTALSPAQMPTETVLAELRRRDLISLELAGRLHELQRAMDRAGESEARPADADVALAVVSQLKAEVSRRGGGPAPETGRGLPSGTAMEPAAADEPDGARGPRRPLYLLGGVATLLVVIAVLVYPLGRESEMERGVAAFAQDSAGVAERHFRAVLEQDVDNVTARLYLGRILRSQGRTAEAADVLRAAARTAPADAAVRRELGYLFLDLAAPASAVEQFRRAVELEPDDPLNWVGLVTSLRAAGDPAAEEWLRRAPAEARTLIQNRPRGRQ
ncbi:MAG: tetratricopeptide repeat protein [Gemmatimonadota bacterium]